MRTIRSKPVKAWSIFILLRDESGKILLVLNRSEKKEDEKTKPEGWGLPGGHVDTYEIRSDGYIDLKSAIKRELEEETGLDINNIDLSFNFKNVRLPLFEDKKDWNDKRAISRVIVLFGQLKGLIELAPRPASDIIEARWFNPSEIDNLGPQIYKSHRRRIRQILDIMESKI